MTKHIERIESIEDVWDVFPDGEADEMNWLFCSTSGVHGSYTRLDALFKRDSEYPNEPIPTSVTLLIVQPRRVEIQYGHVEVTPEDVPRLRRLVETTLEAVAKSQEGNLP